MFNLKILRNMNGEDVEFELTRGELYSAYEEQQHIFDKADVEDIIDQMDDDTIMANYGVSMAAAEDLVDEIAYRMRRYIDKYDMSWESARDEAIKDVIAEYRK